MLICRIKNIITMKNLNYTDSLKIHKKNCHFGIFHLYGKDDKNGK